jgi:hypothetical protein
MSAAPDDWYAPNQQAVRGDESGPAEEGEGGQERIDPEPLEPGEPLAEAESGQEDLDALTKAQLLELARSRGVTPANNDMTKEELKEAIEAG